MTLRELIRKRVLGVIGLSRIENLPKQEEKLTFINDTEIIKRHKIREYNVWYEGDSDELLNFYTYNAAISYNYEPFFDRNKRNYFWSINSTEGGIKRTHSGQAKNIIDTLTCIVGIPEVKAGHPKLDNKNKINQVIQEVIEENDFFNTIYKQKQMPLTMVEGWGCYKIAWDKDISENPIPIYYRAEDVEFIYKLNRVVGIIFKDYYTDGKKKYLIAETRYLSRGNLYIETEVYEMFGEEDDCILKPVDMESLEPFKYIEKKLEITNFRKLLAVPCVFYQDSSDLMYGRSMLSGKIDLLDDLDQCLSQAANTVRKSTPVEYFDINFLERDKYGMPVQPQVYDRKYVYYKGALTSDGDSTNTQPVQVTQPVLDFEQYDRESTAILLQIMNGLISPATLGMDIAKKDNAEAQREKEKITVFTRKNISEIEEKILKDLFVQILCAKELMETNNITVTDYDVSIIFPEFADDSFENKISVLGEQLAKGSLSYKMYLSKLYGGRLSEDDFNDELEYLKDYHENEERENPIEDMFALEELQDKETA